MQKKMERMLHLTGDLYTLDDIMELIEDGKFQSFVEGDTWIVTQVNEFPRRKVLEITFVVGDINEAVRALPRIYEHAENVGADRINALGREGWWVFADAGWSKVGVVYAKDK